MIIKRELQRRHGIRQSSPPENLMHHHHALWDDKIITLFASGTRYTNTTYQAIGAKVVLNPIVLMYIVRAELVTTADFVAGGDSFTIKLSVGSNDYEYTFTSALTYGNSITDIRVPITDFFNIFEEAEFNISIKVSNAGNPVTLHGAYLKFTIYQEDSYGDYANSVKPMLIARSNINKEPIKLLDDESKEFVYLSGIIPK